MLYTPAICWPALALFLTSLALIGCICTLLLLDHLYTSLFVYVCLFGSCLSLLNKKYEKKKADSLLCPYVAKNMTCILESQEQCHPFLFQYYEFNYLNTARQGQDRRQTSGPDLLFYYFAWRVDVLRRKRMKMKGKS